MERGLESCRRSESNGLWAPPITAAVDLQSRVQETLDLLSPQELSNFRIFLKSVDEEPRVTPLRLELAGNSKERLAGLLVQHYCEPASASRVLIKVLQQLRRADLLRRWQGAGAADDRGELGGQVPGLRAGPGEPGVLGMGGRVRVSAGFGTAAPGVPASARGRGARFDWGAERRADGRPGTQ